MTFTPVLLTGKFQDGSGSPLSGTLTVTLSQSMSNGGLVVIPNAKVLTLDSNGKISQIFYANTDLNTVPYRGAWYQITENLISETPGASGASGTPLAQGQQRDYSIQIPAFDAPYSWSFNPTTTVGNVGPGNAAFNNTVYANVTQMFVSITDTGNNSTAAWLDSLVDGNVSVYSISAPGNYVIFAVTGYTVSGNVIILDVTYITSQGTLPQLGTSSLGALVGYGGDLILGKPITTIDISALMPGTPGGFSPTGTNPAGSVQWTTYLDMPEVLQWLQFTSAPIPGSNESNLLQRLIDSACCIAQDIAGRPLAPTTFYERHDGWSGEYIQLHYSPVIQVLQCQEFQSTGGFIQLTESTPQNPGEGIQIDYRTGQIMRTFAGYSWPRPFYPGSRNIEVTYVAGYDPVPHNVWMATVNLVAYWWRNWYQASRTFTKTPAGSNQQATVELWPGVPDEIAEVFESYYLHTVG